VNRKNKKYTRKSAYLKTVSVLVGCVALGIIAWVTWIHYRSPAKPTASATDTSSRKTSLTANTPSIQASNDSHKAAIAQQNTTAKPTTLTATPVIDFAGYDNPPTDTEIEIDSHVNGIVEDGGTCTLTATLSGQTVTKTVTAVRNADDTSCPAFILNPSDFPSSGTWNIQVSYSSATYSGTSQSQTLQVKQ